MKDLTAAIIKYWPVLFRGWLYFMIAALPVMITAVQPFADSGVSPTFWQVTMGVLSATSAGLVALRAFYDGSAQRHQDATSGNTRFMTKPTP